ncbi:hypothetical protein FQR65_LT09340 [Abscondita terminalis]|nr:hypothetical protein FQR65_LT09340 [Abscondita terminalis]
MTALEYDESLSAAAQNITNKCEFEHFSVDDSAFECTMFKNYFFILILGRWWFVGQNMYLFSTTSPTLKRTWSYVIDKWFGEHIYYIYPDGPSDGTVHYTQIASIYTEYVGCGYTMFIKSQFWFYHLFICNYGPGGNYNGVPPYDAAK